MSEEIEINEEPNIVKPVFLKVISILSFIYLGFQSIKLFLYVLL